MERRLLRHPLMLFKSLFLTPRCRQHLQISSKTHITKSSSILNTAPVKLGIRMQRCSYRRLNPKEPIHLVVYNHGFNNSAKKSINEKDLQEQMKDAPPNTVLIVPEWQANPEMIVSSRKNFATKEQYQNYAARLRDEGKFAAPGQFRNMVQEIFDNTQGLQGLTWANVDKVGIISHSAGYAPAENELYSNHIEGKVNSITLLDALYDPTGFDPWIKQNIGELERGTKRFYNIYENTSENSAGQIIKGVFVPGQEQRIQQWLGSHSNVMFSDSRAWPVRVAQPGVCRSSNRL